MTNDHQVKFPILAPAAKGLNRNLEDKIQKRSVFILKCLEQLKTRNNIIKARFAKSSYLTLIIPFAAGIKGSQF